MLISFFFLVDDDKTKNTLFRHWSQALDSLHHYSLFFLHLQCGKRHKGTAFAYYIHTYPTKTNITQPHTSLLMRVWAWNINILICFIQFNFFFWHFVYGIFKSDNALATMLRKNKQTHPVMSIGKSSCIKFALKMVLNEGMNDLQIEIWWDNMAISRNVRWEIEIIY